MAAISSGTVSAAESGPGWPASPGRALKDLTGLDDRELLGIVRSLPRASDRRAAAGELLVSRHQGLVRSCARPYLGSPVPAEDLMQVRYVGLLKAISNFDPAGTRASTAPALASQPPKGHEPATGADRLCGGLGRISATALPASGPGRQGIPAIRA
jgi:hypothetical protein